MGAFGWVLMRLVFHSISYMALSPVQKNGIQHEDVREGKVSWNASSVFQAYISSFPDTCKFTDIHRHRLAFVLLYLRRSGYIHTYTLTYRLAQTCSLTDILPYLHTCMQRTPVRTYRPVYPYILTDLQIYRPADIRPRSQTGIHSTTNILTCFPLHVNENTRAHRHTFLKAYTAEPTYIYAHPYF